MDKKAADWDVPAGFNISLRNTWLLVNRSRQFTAQLRQQYGEAVTFFRGQEPPMVVLLTPESARQALTGMPDGYDAFWKEGFTGVAGSHSLWVLSGDAHRQERSLLSTAFHASNYRRYGETIRETARKKTADWQPGQTRRILDTTLSISLEVILRIVFGIESGRFVEPGQRVLYDLWRMATPYFIFFPWLMRSWFPPWRRYTAAKEQFTAWVNDIVTERRINPVQAGDVLGQMLTMRYEDGSMLNLEAIRDELITLLMAGNETTATALAWALYELVNHPDVLAKLRQELDPLGPDPDPGLVTRLPYLSAVCNETLRLHTLLPEVGRVLFSPLELCGHTLPVGTSVVVSVMAIHHDPGLYPEPDLYNPERFIQRSYGVFEFMPFGGGHRRCLGSGLSDYEMRISLAEIVTHWDFTPFASEQEVRHDIAMGSKNGVLLHINGRWSGGERTIQ